MTFRLFDALPRDVIERADSIRDDAISAAMSIANAAQRAAAIERADRRHRATIEAFLDRGEGACFLQKDACAALVEKSLAFLDDDRYHLLASTVMPNHVHVVFQMLGYGLDRVLGSWKRQSAQDINRALRRNGHVWQSEYFDTLIRDSRHLVNAVRYVLKNPERAGLKKWPWTYLNEAAMARLI